MAILIGAVGFLVGMLVGGLMKQCPTAGVTKPATNWWDVLVAAVPVARDIFDDTPSSKTPAPSTSFPLSPLTLTWFK